MRQICLPLMLLVTIACESETSTSSECKNDTSGYESGRWQPPEPKPFPSGELSAITSQRQWTSRLEFGKNIPQTDSVVWWPVGQDLEMRYAWSLGSSVGALRDARLVVLLDNLQVQLGDDKAEAEWYLTIAGEPGEAGFVSGTIGDDLVETGAHTMVTLAIGAASGNVVDGNVVTIIRGSPVFSEMQDDSESVRISDSRDYLAVASGGRLLPTSDPIDTVSEGGVLPIQFNLQTAMGSGCTNMRVPVVGTIFVDFRQAPMPAFGAFVRVPLLAEQAAIVEADVQVPPPDEQRHVLTVVLYQGDGMFTEAPPGTYTPWHAAQPISIGTGFY